MSHWEDGVKQRKDAGAQDFIKGVQRRIEEQFEANICSLEELPEKRLVSMLDFAGVDAFFERKHENPAKVYGLSSRVNWSAWFENVPHFSFRFAYWDERARDWKPRKEYAQKLKLAARSDKPIYPELHVESFSAQKGTGRIKWAYMARTSDIISYIQPNFQKIGTDFETSGGVIIKEAQDPKTKQRRKVIAVPVGIIADIYMTDEILIK